MLKPQSLQLLHVILPPSLTAQGPPTGGVKDRMPCVTMCRAMGSVQNGRHGNTVDDEHSSDRLLVLLLFGNVHPSELRADWVSSPVTKLATVAATRPSLPILESFGRSLAL